MNLGLSSVTRGLPGLIGVLFGILLYAQQSIQPVLVPAILLFGTLGLLLVGNRLIIGRPRLALACIELWALSALCITALVTQGLLWLTVASPGWFALPAGELDAVKGALIGAVTAYFAGVWIKDIQDNKGPFLASTQFQAASREFGIHHGIKGDSVYAEACYSETVRTGISGWGILSRWRRARLLAAYLSRTD